MLDFGPGDTSRFTLASLSVEARPVKMGGAPKLENATAVRFGSSFTQSLIDAVFVTSEDGTLDFTSAFPVAFDLGAVTDSVTLREIQVWGVSKTGVVVGRGSQVVIKGGRIIGNGHQSDAHPRGTSVGVHCTGGNGGVHVAQTDVISHLEGMRVDASSGAASNREIFIAHATFDSCWRGLSVYDSSYVDVSGLWAASCEDANVFVAPQAGGALFSIAGGTIFNACSEQGGAQVNMTADRRCIGMDVHAGSFTLSGVSVRNNQGVGLAVASAVSSYAVTGVKFYSNGAAVELEGSDFVLTGNVFKRDNSRSRNKIRCTSDGSSACVIANNVGLEYA